MTKTFEEIMCEEAKIAEAKELVGGEVYKMSYKLPSLCIENKEKLETFINYTKLAGDISDKFGSDFSLLYAELYNLYNIDENDQNQPDQNLLIISCGKAVIASSTLSLEQCNKLLEILNSHKDNFDNTLKIEGKDYCFIVNMLNIFLSHYSTVISLIIKKQYLNKEFIESIHERLSFIVSNEFESLRRLFKVVECYKAIETKPTFH